MSTPRSTLQYAASADLGSLINNIGSAPAAAAGGAPAAGGDAAAAAAPEPEAEESDEEMGFGLFD